VTLQQPTLFGAIGTQLRGHEFHYSELCTDPLQHPQWQAAYQVCANRDGVVHEEGYSRGRILASYVHLHLASNPEALNRFVSVLQKQPD
jgi:cobyrinic acid a,c-diamide synthase